MWKPKSSITWKWAIVERNGVKFGTLWQYWGIFDLLAFKVVFGHSLHLRFFFRKYGFQNTTSSRNYLLNSPQKTTFGFLKF